MPVLVYESGPRKGETIRLEDDRIFALGRDPKCDVPLDDDLASRVHAKLRGKDGRYFIKDADSSNGTLVNDHRIAQAAELASGDKIGIGSTTLTFLADADAGGGTGRTLGGYKLLQRLGRGGMGTVYRALQLSLNREVALKILSPELSRDPAFVQRFLKEARAAGQLNHPNIVQVYDVHGEAGLLFYSMEFVPAGTVEDRLNKLGRYSVDEAAKILLDAARGLQYAEAKKIVHRDLKPDNLMLTEIGTAKIADLGLALSTHEGEAEPGGILGTPHFISPEQARRLPLDTRSDLYSLGATFFRMLTGRTMYSGANAEEIVRKQVKDAPPDLRAARADVPERVALIFQKMVQKDPAQRYPTAAALIADVESAMAVSTSRKGPLLVAAAALLLGGGAAAFFALRGGGEPQPIAPVESTVNPESDHRAEQLSQELAQKDREMAALSAYSELRAGKDALEPESYLERLRGVAAEYEGTESGAKALAEIAEIEQAMAADARARAELDASVSSAVAALEARIAEPLAQDRVGDALLAFVEAGAPAAAVAADPRFTAARDRARQQIDAALQAARLRAEGAANSGADPDGGDRAVAQLRAIGALAPRVPADESQLAARVAELAAIADRLAADLTAASERRAAEALAADLRALRADFDWNSAFAAIREYRFADAAAALEQVRHRLATDAYRNMLDRRIADLRAAAPQFQRMLEQVESGAAAKASVRHPEREQVAEVSGLAPEGDGLLLTTSKGAGSSKSAVRFKAFAGAEACLDLLGIVPPASGADCAARVRAALIESAAQVNSAAGRLREQLVRYDPNAGWTAELRLPLRELPPLALGSEALDALLAAADRDPSVAAESAELRRRAGREREARALFERAIRPFLDSAAAGGFSAAVPLLEQLARDYRDTDLFFAAYELFDDGRAALPLVAPGPDSP